MPKDHVTRKAGAQRDRHPARVPEPAAPARSLIGRLVAGALQRFKRPPARVKPLVFESFEPRVLLSGETVAPRIDGSLDVPGETDRYGFTLNDNVRVVFDSLTNNADMRWSLEGPRGSVVSGRSFTASDSYERSGDVAFDLAAGEYTLTVDGVADTTGDYAFRLIDLAQAEELTIGTRVDATLEPANETDAYRFSVVAGQRFYFDRFSNTGDIYWRLIDPFGRTVVDRTHMNNDIGERTLAIDGSYTLLIEGRAYTSGSASYSFNVALIDDDATQAMALDARISGRIDQAGLRDHYSFTLASDTRVLFDSLTNDYYLTWSLTGPGGTLVADRRMQYSDSHEIGGNSSLLLRAGDYTLTVDGDGDHVGDYAFRLLDLASATSIAADTVITGTLGDTGIDAKRFRSSTGAPLNDPPAGNRALLANGNNRYLSVADDATLRPEQLTLQAWVYKDPSLPAWGGVLMKSSVHNWNDGYGLTHYTDGRIHFFVNQYNTNEVSAALADNTWTHVAGTFDGTTLKLYINGELSASKDYAATIDHSSAELRIGSGSGANYPWRGQIDEAQIWNVARSAEDIAATYQNSLQGNEAGLVGYWRMDETDGESFIDSSSAGNDGTLVNPPGRETHLYRYTASAGERLYFDYQDVSGDNLSLRIFDPVGNLVYGPQWFSNDVDTFTAARSGDYTFALEGRIGHSNASHYRFALLSIDDSSQAMSFDSQIDGNLSKPGQRSHHTFTVGDTPVQLLFDALTQSNNLRWNLTGPDGTLVANRGFSSSDGIDLGSANPLLVLAQGDYTLTVYGINGQFGDFAFRLLNLATASAGADQLITYDTQVDGSLNPGSLTRIYRFEASSGDEVAFDRLALSSGSPYWRLLDRTGFQVFGSEYFNDRGATRLELGGTYYLVFEGRIYDTNTVDYSFALNLLGNTPVAERTGTAIALDPSSTTLPSTVSGNLGVAGEVDDYVFDIDGPTRIVFDSFAPNNNGNFRWSLLGPRGTEIDDRGLYYSESHELGGTNPVIDLPLAGRYQVRIWAYGNTTGDYSFRVLDVATATPITPGNDVAGDLAANETDIYRFDAVAGERLFFNHLSQTPTNNDYVTWRLIDPNGRQVWGPINFRSDVDVTTLTRDGTYTLLVENRIWHGNTFDYRFNIQPVPADPVAVALVLGEETVGNLEAAGQTNTYTFELASEDLYYFDSLSDKAIGWTLSGPDGVVLSRTLQNADSYERGHDNPVLRLGPGSYTLQFDGSGDTAGEYRFRIFALAEAAVDFVPGTIVDDTLDGARETHVYRFDAVAGERYYLDYISYRGYSDATYRLIDAQGNQVWGGYDWPNDREMAAFSIGGSYYLLVEGRIINTVATSDYSFNLHQLVDISASLTVGETVSGTFDQPGQRAIYRFSLTEARQLLFDALAPNNANPDIYWSLSGPRGTEISSRRFYGSESHELGGTSPLLDLIAGDYTLTLDPPNTQSGAFSFRLLDIANATHFDGNTTVHGTLDPSNTTAIYTFDATTGTRYYLDQQGLSVSTDRLSWRLFDPLGNQVFGPLHFNDVDLFTVPQDGRYTLIVEGRIWETQYVATVDYHFRLLEITDDFADIVPGESYGLVQHFRPGPLGQALDLDSLRHAEVPDSDDIDQTGSLTLEAWFKVDAYASTWQALFYKGNGNSNQRTYTLWLNNNGYLHLSSGNNANHTISTAAGSISTNRWYHVAAVLDRDSDTGQMKIYIDGVEAASGALNTTAASTNDNPLFIGRSPEGNPNFLGQVDDIRLWNTVRSAQQIADHKDQPLAGNEDGLVLYLKADDGTGTTLADATGRGNDATLVHVWADTAGVVAGSIDYGQSDYYRFTLADDTRLYFDSLTDNYYLRWYLSGPRGTVVSDRPFQQSDSQNGLSVLDLVAGDYTLRVDGSGDASGDYGFRLLDLGNAVALERDTVITGELTPATETNAYQFSASAGERLYFDMVSASGGYPFWRLLDPWGRTVWGANYLPNDDVQLRTLPYDGTYTLLVEGRRDSGNGTSSYAFQVRTVQDKTIAITPDAVVGMPEPWGDGPIGGALRFNGLQSAQIAHDAALDLAETVTLETWVRVDRFDNTWTPLIYKGQPDNAQERTFSLWLHSNGSVLFSTGDGNLQSAQTAAGAVAPGQWHHIAAVMDRNAGTARILVDGVQLAGVTNLRKNPASSNAEPVYLGTAVEAVSSHANLVGGLDEVRIWNIARDNADIVATKDAALSGSETGLVAYLRADEGGGASAADATGNGHDASLAGVVEPVVIGNIDHVGQVVHYTFSLSEDITRLYLDALTDNSNVRWTLTGPRGTLVSGRHFQQSDSIDGLSMFDLVAGDYTLTIDGHQDFTGEFRLRLLDLSQASALTPGTPVTGQLTPANQTDAWQFTAAAGQRFFFDRQAESAGNAWWRLIDPYGRVVWGATDFGTDGGLRTLAQAGTYTVLIEGRRNAVGSNRYTFNVQPVVDASSALERDQRVSGAIAHPGQVRSHTFTLDADSLLLFDSLTNSTSFKWSLTGPRGTIVSARNFADSDSNDYTANPVLDLVAGDYTLLVDGDNDTTGDYG
ncbi:MAG: LamG domain-containing protein, partial [Rhodoferax sp.]|nr:LamG domain-containing protein [Rhodoferax sp.]